MSHTHEAGWAHASGALRGPSWLREPSDPNELVQQLWSSTATKADGVLSVTPDTPEVAEWRSKSPLDCVATTSTYLDDDDDGGSAVRGLRSVVRRARALGSARLAPERVSDLAEWLNQQRWVAGHALNGKLFAHAVLLRITSVCQTTAAAPVNSYARR